MPVGGSPDVRVGIVSFNTAELLERCLAALPTALGDLGAEIVVVDNASSDASADVAARHDGVRVVRNDENVGYARAINEALAGTEAPALLALNPDAVAPPGSLAALVATLHATPRAGLIVPRLRNADGSLQHSVHRFPSVPSALVTGFVPPPLRRGPIGRHWWLEGFSDFDRGGDVDWAIGAVHVIRRAALDDPDHAYSERWFMYAEDMELCWRLHGDGWQVVLDPEVSVTHVGNVAGAQQWGTARDERWLAATYDWYAESHGRRAARAWAAANCAGLATKLAAALAARDREHADRLRTLLAIHRRYTRARWA